MQYVKLIDGVPKTYTLNQLRADNPHVSFPKEIHPPLLAEYGVFMQIGTDRPIVDTTLQYVTEGVPEYRNDLWYQTWVVTDFTDSERAAQTPRVVSMRQARLALLQYGMLDSVNTTIAEMPDVEGEAARIEWEYATEVRRDSALVAGMQHAMDLDPMLINQLFTLAATL
jgi:hypothetical protein